MDKRHFGTFIIRKYEAIKKKIRHSIRTNSEECSWYSVQCKKALQKYTFSKIIILKHIDDDIFLKSLE